MPISKTTFGHFEGKPVGLWTLANNNGLQASITGYGARVVSLLAPDRHGQTTDVVLGFDDLDRLMDLAFEAAHRLGIPPIRKAIRGGTDGARLTYMGLPTPNLWAGGQNFHSIKEWVSLEWMVKSVEFTLQLLGLWVERSARA